MSKAHDRRRKTIKRMKKEYGSKWRTHFVELCENIRKKQDGEFIGTLADVMMRTEAK